MQLKELIEMLERIRTSEPGTSGGNLKVVAGPDEEDLTSVMVIHKPGVAERPICTSGGGRVIRREEHHGAKVWTETVMDELRKSRCLCLQCDHLGDCCIAKTFYDNCKTFDVAVAITRCRIFDKGDDKPSLLDDPAPEMVNDFGADTGVDADFVPPTEL